jgi:DNA-binding GntR family transcriptional regulator
MSDEHEPRWLQVARDICARIEVGDTPVGTKVASQVKLTARYDASPGTIKRAIAHLQDVGVLGGRQGAGVFVLREPVATDLAANERLGERLAELERRLVDAPTRAEMDELRQKVDALVADRALDASTASSAAPHRSRRASAS